MGYMSMSSETLLRVAKLLELISIRREKNMVDLLVKLDIMEIWEILLQQELVLFLLLIMRILYYSFMDQTQS